MYVARARPCTQSVHGRGRSCTHCARPPSAVYKLCTRPYTGHAHGPSVSRTRPCTQPVRGKTRPGTRPVPDRVRTVYMAVHGPCTAYTAVFTARVHGSVRTMYTAVHGSSMTRTRPCTRSCTCTRPCLRPVYSTRPVPDRVRTVYMAVHVSCTVYTAVFTARVHGPVRTMYTAVHGPSKTRTRPCTRSCTLYTAVNALCTRPLNAGVVHPVNGRVHGHIHGTYTAVHTGRKHGRLHDRKHGRVHGHGRTMYLSLIHI